MSLCRCGKDKGHVGRCRGVIPWNRGRPWSKKEREKIGSGVRCSYQNGREPWDKNKKRPPFSRKWKDNMSKAHLGKKKSKSHRRNISLARMGKKNPMHGKRGELAPRWIDGRSFKPYPKEFNGVLKREIRERDEYVCQLCESSARCVHHIDYNKENCEEWNLIVLCNSCNNKVNFNRDFWYSYFTSQVKGRRKRGSPRCVV